MPRRNRRQPGAAGPRPSPGWAKAESGSDGEWLVRNVPGAEATKLYRCPGCDHEIRQGTPHVVAWPAGEAGSVADRRHWHRPCWDARQRRGPTRRRR